MLSVPLATRFSPGALIVSGLLASLAGVAALSVFGQSMLALWAGTLAVGVGFAPIFAALLALAAQRMPITGAATGWFLVGAACGSMLIPPLIGQFVESAGAWVIMAAIGAVLALMLGLIFVPLKLLPSAPALSVRVEEIP
jgi:MFS family permease